MKMRLLVAFLSLLLVNIGVNAQKSFVFVRGGLNFANVSITNDGDIDKANSLTSFQAGIVGNLHIAPFFSLQPGIIFTGKGSKTESGSTSDPTYFRANSHPYYIEVPVNLVFKTPTGPIKFFVGAGPYIAVGVAGKNTVDGKFLGTAFHSEEDIQWSDDDPSTLDYEEGAGYGIMKRFDYGLNGLAGIEFKKTILGINYGLGLAKLQSGSDSGSDDKNKNRVFSVTVGFKL